jgi:hypothetical protein
VDLVRKVTAVAVAAMVLDNLAMVQIMVVVHRKVVEEAQEAEELHHQE